MYELVTRTSFSAAHRLMGYDGPCENLHGHNWEVAVFIRGNELDETGMLVDFREVRRRVEEILAEMDHSDLNALRSFDGKNPTSENIARHIFEALGKSIKSSRYSLHRVEVSETPKSGVSYSISGIPG